VTNDPDERELQIFLLSARVSLWETLFLRLWLKYQKSSDHAGVKAVQAEFLRELKQHGRMADTVYLSDEKLARLKEHQRAALADYYREVVEEMKASVKGLTDG
jgi:hypothetical protein